jgi:NarL family two-component system response regulator LiaR
MRRHVLIYGLLGGILIALLQWSQYRFLVIEHSIEIYSGLVAAIFAGLGIWLGLRITGKPRPAPPAASLMPAASIPELTRPDSLGITPREFEILELIAKGLSNREIAATLYVSENTVKTHSSRVFDKLGAKRRTQAVQMGKELGLLP